MAAIDEKVAAYSGLVKSLARRYSYAEFDDLYQEGMLAVLLALRAGGHVSKAVIQYRMINWCTYLRRLANNDAIAYEKLLPMEHHAIDSV